MNARLCNVQAWFAREALLWHEEKGPERVTPRPPPHLGRLFMPQQVINGQDNDMIFLQILVL